MYPKYFKHILLHSLGRWTPPKEHSSPRSEYPEVYRRARIYVAIYAAVIGLSIYSRSILPLLFIGLANLFGTWLMVVYGLTQHAGLAENVLDHRLNCRTVYMNPIHRYPLLEHELPRGAPHVPAGALPRAAEAARCREGRLPDAISESPCGLARDRSAVLRQVKDPAYHVKRKLPEPEARVNACFRSSHAAARC